MYKNTNVAVALQHKSDNLILSYRTINFDQGEDYPFFVKAEA